MKSTVSRTKPRVSHEERRSLTCRRLVASAAKVFLKKGFAHASLEEITELAGMTRGAFYSNFESKEDLLLAYLQQAQSARLKALSDIVTARCSPEERLESVRTFLMEEISQKDRYVLFLEFKMSALRNRDLKTRWLALKREQHSALEQLVGKVFSELGLNSRGLSKMITRSVGAYIEGLSIQLAFDPEGMTEETAREYVGQVWQRILDELERLRH